MHKLSETVTFKYESINEMEKHQQEMADNEWAVKDSYLSYDGKTIVEYEKEWE